MARTPEEWLPILTKRLDDDRSRVALLRSHMDGNAPLPEAGGDTREAWQQFQKEARTNWGQLILEAVTDRIVPRGITIAGDSQSEVAKRAQRIWRDNRMDEVFAQWLRDGLGFRTSYMTCWQGDNDRAVITADSPESMTAAVDPLQPWRVRAALRCWRDSNVGKDYAMVWSEDSRQRFWRPSMETTDRGSVLHTLVSGKWYPEDNELDPTFTGEPPPVVVYNNPGGVGEFEPHLDIINRINKGVLRRLSIESMQAFRQRALLNEGGQPLPQFDENGNAIDWAARFSPAPAALWELPPGIKLWESTPTDISNLLQSAKDDLRSLAAVTRTPVPILMPDNTNTSAAGAISADAGYITRCAKRLIQAKIGGEAILLKALELEGVEGLEDQTINLMFKPVELVSMAERYQAAAAAKSSGESQKAIDRDIHGKTADEMRQDALDRADEALRAAAMLTRNDIPSNRPQ